MTPASLTSLLNSRTFNYKGAPISDVTVTIEDGRIKQKGTLHKGVAVPFTIVADISATRDGRIRLHPQSVKTGGMPIGGLMGLLHLELDDLVSSNRARGFEAQDDDFLLQPDKLLPDPKISGRLTAIRVDGDRIVAAGPRDGGRAELHALPRQRAAVRPVDDERYRCATDRRRPKRSVRLLAEGVRQASRRRLFEELR